MFDSFWEFSLYSSKFLTYLAATSFGGGCFCALLYSDGSRAQLRQLFLYILMGSILGFHAIVASFLIQVGNISRSGFGGMFDWDMASFLFQLPVGAATLLRLVGFMSGILGSLLFLKHLTQRRSAPGLQFQRVLLIWAGISLILIAVSFRATGHMAEQPLVSQLGVAIHVITVSLWIGSLYPLWLLCSSSELSFLQHALKRFGDNAVALLLALFASGIVMTWNMLSSVSQLWETAWGLSLVVKLLLVGAILIIAAYNKLRIVPAMLAAASATKMQLSLRYEIVVALLILATTAYLSTIVGLEH